jgi:hypothetical protein
LFRNQLVTQKTQQDIKSIVEQVLVYKGKTQTMLKNEAKKRGINLPNGIKQDEIIVLLMSTEDKRLVQWIIFLTNFLKLLIQLMH